MVAEGAAKVGEQIPISGSEDKTCAELERVLTEPVLAVAGSLGSSARLAVVAAKDVERVR